MTTTPIPSNDTSTPEAATPPPDAKPVSRTAAMGVTLRSVLLGLLFTIAADLWIHYAELIMGGRQGHTAIAATSTPVGSFTILFVLTGINLLTRAILPRIAMTGAELLVVYVMVTTSAVLSSSGQLHFIMPTVVAAWHYASDANGWASLFHRFVPHWMAQTDPVALKGFYEGKADVAWGLWLPQMGTWITFMLALAFASLCIASLLRRSWVDRERLSFPTVALPLALCEDKVPIFKNALFWFGAAVPFAFAVMNTVALNAPAVPYVSLRADTNIAQNIADTPWNALNPLNLSFYPFVIGIAYLIPVDVTFSSWFFYLVTKGERVFGAAFNIDASITGAQRATFPYIGHQGAGAFLALTIVTLWLNRGYLKEVAKSIFREPGGLDDTDEPLTYRAAAIGLLCAMGVMIGVCVAAGMQPIIAVVLIVLALTYMIAATRIRAETGNAWLFGPEVDVNALMTRTLGTGFLTPSDLTVLAFMRPAVGNFDMRCMPMPHHFDAFKMADAVGVSRRRLFGAICLGTVLGLIASFAIALTLWHLYGAEAKAEPWRTSQGRVPFDNLAALLRNPVKTDIFALGGIATGFLVTTGLILMRTYFVWWPLHPVGYAIANTGTMQSTWLPFFIAWLLKVLVLRYGGQPMYKMFIPFFLGLIAGDLLGGGFTTLFGAFTGISVYPINW
ncbi:MAG: hypothetical protein H7Y38_20720 [Armatimonadetes bacterium]|nr:hypothetical protein [Armatimonadota bacterium]